MNMLFHRGTPWQSEIRCSTNILASHFMRDGCDVAYMHGMVHVGNLVAKTGRWGSWVKGPRDEAGAWVFTPLSIIPYANKWPFNTPASAAMAYHTCLPSIRSQYFRSGLSDPDVIWTANPGSSSLKSLFPKSVLVFQVVDYYPAFSSDNIKNIEKKDYETADHIMVIGETLKQYLIEEHDICDKKITVLGQGVLVDRYQKECPIPNDMVNIKGPIAVWVGVLGKCDSDMFAEVAKGMAKLGGSVIMIGPDAEWAESYRDKYNNVHFLGVRTPEEVPAYLLHSDIGLMLYDQSKQDIYKGQNPLKLYEYAAAGLSIISTQHDEYSYIDPPVITVGDADEVIGAVYEAYEKRVEMKKKSLGFVSNRTWESVYQRARHVINELIVNK